MQLSLPIFPADNDHGSKSSLSFPYVRSFNTALQKFLLITDSYLAYDPPNSYLELDQSLRICTKELIHEIEECESNGYLEDAEDRFKALFCRLQEIQRVDLHSFNNHRVIQAEIIKSLYQLYETNPARLLLLISRVFNSPDWRSSPTPLKQVVLSFWNRVAESTIKSSSDLSSMVDSFIEIRMHPLSYHKLTLNLGNQILGRITELSPKELGKLYASLDPKPLGHSLFRPLGRGLTHLSIEFDKFTKQYFLAEDDSLTEKVKLLIDFLTGWRSIKMKSKGKLNCPKFIKFALYEINTRYSEIDSPALLNKLAELMLDIIPDQEYVKQTWPAIFTGYSQNQLYSPQISPISSKPQSPLFPYFVTDSLNPSFTNEFDLSFSTSRFSPCLIRSLVLGGNRFMRAVDDLFQQVAQCPSAVSYGLLGEFLGCAGLLNMPDKFNQIINSLTAQEFTAAMKSNEFYRNYVRGIIAFDLPHQNIDFDEFRRRTSLSIGGKVGQSCTEAEIYEELLNITRNQTCIVVSELPIAGYSVDFAVGFGNAEDIWNCPKIFLLDYDGPDHYSDLSSKGSLTRAARYRARVLANLSSISEREISYRALSCFDIPSISDPEERKDLIRRWLSRKLDKYFCDQ